MARKGPKPSLGPVVGSNLWLWFFDLWWNPYFRKGGCGDVICLTCPWSTRVYIYIHIHRSACIIHPLTRHSWCCTSQQRRLRPLLQLLACAQGCVEADNVRPDLSVTENFEGKGKNKWLLGNLKIEFGFVLKLTTLLGRSDQKQLIMVTSQVESCWALPPCQESDDVDFNGKQSKYIYFSWMDIAIGKRLKSLSHIYVILFHHRCKDASQRHPAWPRLLALLQARSPVPPPNCRLSWAVDAASVVLKW